MEINAIEMILAEALFLAVLLSAVPLVASMLVGAVVSVLQAATQIQEQTLSFVPKLATVSVVIYFAGPWLGEELSEFAKVAFDELLLRHSAAMR